MESPENTMLSIGTRVLVRVDFFSINDVSVCAGRHSAVNGAVKHSAEGTERVKDGVGGVLEGTRVVTKHRRKSNIRLVVGRGLTLLVQELSSI